MRQHTEIFHGQNIYKCAERFRQVDFKYRIINGYKSFVICLFAPVYLIQQGSGAAYLAIEKPVEAEHKIPGSHFSPFAIFKANVIVKINITAKVKCVA